MPHHPEPNSVGRELLHDQAAIDENRIVSVAANIRSQSNELLLTGAGGINAIAVTELSDLPTPVGGDITLVENTLYYFLGEIDIGANRIVCRQNTPIVGRQARIDSIVGNNATELILFDQTAGLGFLMQNLTVAQSGSGHAIHVDSGAGINCIIREVNLLGELHVDDCGAVLLDTVLVLPGSTVHFTGTVGDLLIKLGGFVGFSGVSSINMDATSAFGTVLIRESQFITVTGSTGIYLDASATLTKGELSNTVFSGVGTFIDGFEKASDEWFFLSNTGLEDSRDRGTAQWQGSAATVDLPDAAAWRTISDGGSSIIYGDGANEKWELTDTATGELTYNGFQAKGFIVAASITFRRSTGQAIEVEFAIADGGVIDAASVTAAVAGISYTTVTIPMVIVTLGPADFCGLRVRNVDASNPTNDIDVTSAILTVIA
jgi:hypothetical protein